MKRLTLTAALASTALLAGCGQPADKAAAPTPEPVAAEAPMAAMPPAATPETTGHGTGVVTAVDPAAGTVTLDHGPIPEIGWPAMTMSFKAAPALLATTRTGDRVKFDLVMTDGAGEITAISPE